MITFIFIKFNIGRFVFKAIFLLAFITGNAAFSNTKIIDLTTIPDHSLGLSTDFLIETDKTLDLNEAIVKYQAGDFKPGKKNTLNFGIGSRPVWLHLSLQNKDNLPVEKFLMAGVTWLDYFDLYVIHDKVITFQTKTGDEIAHAAGLTPVLGFIFPVSFPAGKSDIFIRIASPDPMAVPIQFLEKKSIDNYKIISGYFYGIFYGFLAALAIYNFLLFVGLKESSYLFYSLALAAIAACNIGYTGHGVAWLWPNYPGFQRHIVLILMVAYNILGILFAIRFLSLSEHAPFIKKIIQWLAIAGVSLLLLSMTAGFRVMEALAAFFSMGLFSIEMFFLGILSLRWKISAGPYFFIATIFGMIGVALTAFSVWGQIPFTIYTFHAAEVGLEIEATLLALALAFRVRQFQNARHAAEKDARRDSLTGLNNRRAFWELTRNIIKSTENYQRPLSVILMDIDHFKSINDDYGHQMGDDSLVAIASLLNHYCRNSDIIARWGGEEFIFLLPETTVKNAVQYAERLREKICSLKVGNQKKISLSASFGVSEYKHGASIQSMIEDADKQLYRAKRSGRNMVCSPQT